MCDPLVRYHGSSGHDGVDRVCVVLLLLLLLSLFRAAKQRFDEDEEFKTRAREGVTRLQVRGEGPRGGHQAGRGRFRGKSFLQSICLRQRLHA